MEFVLVVGSGVHKAVALKHKPPSILASWDELLDKLFTNQGLPRGASRSPPSSKWEELLLFQARRDLGLSPDSENISSLENNLRNALAKMVGDAACVHRVDEAKSRIFKSEKISDIISLNFEVSWAGISPPKIFSKLPGKIKNRIEPRVAGRRTLVNEIYRLYGRMVDSENRNFWFPNGNVGRPSSLRLGYRDFGLHAQALKLAFDRFKSWEESVLPKRAAGTPRSQSDISHLRKRYLEIRNGQYDSHRSALADNWVTGFMIFEPIFLGVGMSPDEQGLWWLLHQRARNLARVPTARPPRILKVCPPCIEAEYGRFLTGNPVLEPIWCRTWEEGWAAVEEILAGKNP